MRYLNVRMVIVTQVVLLASAMAVTGCNHSGGSGGFSGTLSGSSVVPSVTTGNSGTFNAMKSADGIYLWITVTHNVLGITGLTVHGPATSLQNAPVLFDILANQDPPAVNSPNSPIMAHWEITQQAKDWLDQGLLYILLNSTAFPTGELRGQINDMTAAPQPGSFKLGDFYSTMIEGTFSPPLLRERGSLGLTKKAGDAHLENLFNTPLQFRATLSTNTMNWPFTGFAGSTQTIDSATGDISWNADIPIPAEFEEFFAMIFGIMIPPIDQIFPINWEARDWNASSSDPPLDSGTTNIHVAYRGISFLDYPLMTLSELDSAGSQTPTQRLKYTCGLGLAPRKLSFTGSQAIIGDTQTQIAGFYTGAILTADFQMLGGPYPEEAARGVALNPKPCGMITNGEFVCPEFQSPTINAGGWVVLAMMVDAPVPLADPVNSYTYGFVFDQDNNPANNFVNSNPAFENDFFQGTDLWYTVDYTPAGGWLLRLSDARGADAVEVQRDLPTDAGAIVRGNMVMILIPLSELPTANPGVRFTAFSHPGDFGAGGVFGLDFDPGLGEPLLVTNTGP